MNIINNNIFSSYWGSIVIQNPLYLCKFIRLFWKFLCKLNSKISIRDCIITNEKQFWFNIRRYSPLVIITPSEIEEMAPFKNSLSIIYILKNNNKNLKLFEVYLPLI